MAQKDLKKLFFFMAMSAFSGLFALPAHAQLVYIKAVDGLAYHQRDGRSGLGNEIRYGQGIIIDPAGIIATNKHIIGNAQHIYVALSDTQIYEAKLLRHSASDLSLIKINAPHPLKAMAMADPTSVQIGNYVVAIANADKTPLVHRLKSGQIINVFEENSTHNAEFLELNIPLKPGDSGGPVLSDTGSLVGLIMGKQKSDPSKSYAVASNRIQKEYYIYKNSALN